MNASSDNEPLSERAQQLLKALVENYIREGQPVASRRLSREEGIRFSPATIRNVMADLEELGFIAAPHTSAGRIPTVKGYRCFVDSLIAVKPLKAREVSRLEQQLGVEGAQSPKEVVQVASSMLSSLTHLAGVVTVPKRNQQALTHIDFVPIGNDRILTIMVWNDQEVQNRIIHVDRMPSESELRQASNFLTERLAGADIESVRRRLLAELERTRDELNGMMIKAIQLAQQACADDEPSAELLVAGQINLMDVAELSSVEKLRALFEAFNEQRGILHLLDQSLSADGVEIFIGEESGFRLLDDCSVVAAPYHVDEEVVGVLGVIGPTRMAYERVIPIVDVTAKLLATALNSQR